MTCYFPISGFKGENGKFVQNRAHSKAGIPLTIPCRQCLGCRLDHAQEWATRLTHELQFHEQAMFITLTYRDADLPKDSSLELRDWQLFMKRLRERIAPKRVKFYMAAEYGKIDMVTGLSEPVHKKRFPMAPFNPTIGRPHFHAIIFGHEYDDLQELFRNKQGDTIYTSEKLASDWGKGHASIGAVTEQSCGYVARYVTKKITGDQSADHYTRKKVDQDGILLESTPVKAEFSTMSRGNRQSPQNGIGHQWIERYLSDVFPHDRVVLQRPGRPPKIVKTPRYYLRYLEQVNPDLREQIRVNRRKAAVHNKKDNTPERLEQRLVCKMKQTEKLTRGHLYDS